MRRPVKNYSSAWFQVLSVCCKTEIQFSINNTDWYKNSGLTAILLFIVSLGRLRRKTETNTLFLTNCLERKYITLKCQQNLIFCTIFFLASSALNQLFPMIFCTNISFFGIFCTQPVISYLLTFLFVFIFFFFVSLNIMGINNLKYKKFQTMYCKLFERLMQIFTYIIPEVQFRWNEQMCVYSMEYMKLKLPWIVLVHNINFLRNLIFY